jgi:hypothetical protein
MTDKVESVKRVPEVKMQRVASSNRGCPTVQSFFNRKGAKSAEKDRQLGKSLSPNLFFFRLCIANGQILEILS